MYVDGSGRAPADATQVVREGRLTSAGMRVLRSYRLLPAALHSSAMRGTPQVSRQSLEKLFGRRLRIVLGSESASRRGEPPRCLLYTHEPALYCLAAGRVAAER